MTEQNSQEDGNEEEVTLIIHYSSLFRLPCLYVCVSLHPHCAKEAGNVVFLIGETKNELGGSHLSLVRDLSGGQVPVVDAGEAKNIFQFVHNAIQNRLIRSCHDLSEGGLAVAAVEMAFAGGLGMDLELEADPMCSAREIKKEALRAEQDDDIAAVILGCAGMVQVVSAVRDTLKIETIDPVACAAKCLKWMT